MFFHENGGNFMMIALALIFMELFRCGVGLSIRTGEKPMFSFGVIADIQYANSPDHFNFKKTKLRRYKNSLEIYKQAIDYWIDKHSINFSILLGDIVDGRSILTSEQKTCLEAVRYLSRQANFPTYICSGNHCHYCFSREEIKQSLAEFSGCPEIAIVQR